MPLNKEADAPVPAGWCCRICGAIYELSHDHIRHMQTHSTADYKQIDAMALAENCARLTRTNEALVKALEECLGQAEGCWINHYGDNPEGGSVPHHIEHARAALKLARGEG